MKRGNARLFFVLLLVAIISLSFISASWFSDFFKITGQQVSDDGCENFILNESTPQIILEHDVSLSFLDADSVSLLIDNETIESLSEGEEQILSDGFTVTVNEIMFTEQENETSSVNLTLCEGEAPGFDVDLTVLGINYTDNNTFYVNYCNLGNSSSPTLVSVMLENGNYTYTTDETLSIPAPGECATSSGIPRDLIHFLPYDDIIIATVDANNSINESNEENNDLTVRCFIDGHCSIYVEPICEDSDFGADLYTKGFVETVSSIGTITLSNDACSTDGDDYASSGRYVRETLCNGTIGTDRTYECPWGCQDGACLKRKPIVDFGDTKGYAVDYQTNLFWQRQSSSDRVWNDARTYCEGLNLGGYIDWRLPTLDELEQLYPASFRKGDSGFLGDSEIVGSYRAEITGSVIDGNAVTGVGMRATGGDINRIRLEVRPLMGCNLGEESTLQFGSGLEQFIAAPKGYVVTGVGAGCDEDCDITHLAITTRKLNFPCTLGEPEIIYTNSRGPERMYTAQDGYIVTGVTVRASPGNIRGLTLQYKPFGLIPQDKFLDITINQDYWTGDRLEGNTSYAYVLKWFVNETEQTLITSNEVLSNRNSVICVRDGRITPEQSTDVGSCQLCREVRNEGTSFLGITIVPPTTTKWDCVGFDDTPLLTDFTRDIRAGDIFNLKVGCGDERLINNCSLSVRYADYDGREDEETVWNSVNFDGTVLSTDFVGDVNSDDDFDLSMDCNNAVIRESCQLCRRYADRNGRANAEWECVNLDGTSLITDFVGDVNSDDDFDLKVRCNVPPAPSCIDTDVDELQSATYDTDEIDTLYLKGSCTNLNGDVSVDYCNGTKLTEFSCGEGEEEGFECVSTEHNCPYGCLDGACLKREETNDAYFVYSKQGDFDVTLKELIGANHEIYGVNFKDTRFKMIVDLRLLSATTATSGYTDDTISSAYDVNNFAQINSIQRHNYESYSGDDRVPETVFGGDRFQINNLEGVANIVDLSDESANETYIYKEEQLDRYYAPGVGVIHSSRHETSDIDVVSAPSFTSGVYADDGIASTYGNGAYAYVDFFGDLHFRYNTQNQNSRAVFMVGILACECSAGEERCDGRNYITCDDGCSIVNNGEVVGYCGVIQPCVDSDNGMDYFVKGTINTSYDANSDGYIIDGNGIAEDRCVDEFQLTEYYCENNVGVSVGVTCELGCQDGRCIDCIDSDSGKDYSTFGNVLGRDISGALFRNETDRCLGDTLVERICTNGYADSVFFDCPLTHGGCKNGLCLGIDCRVELDNVSECGTSAYNVDGILFCSIANGSKYEFELYNVSECELGCSNGVCETPTCTDYDEGVYDSVTKSNATSSLGTFLVDSCSDEDTLQEAICDEGELTKESRECVFGCSNGRCLGESSCNDTDIGLNYFVKGTSVSCVGTDCITGENESCVDGNNLWESYCGRNDEIIWQQFLCPEGCVNGACNIPEERPNATCAPATIGGAEIRPGIRLVVDGQLSYCDPFTLTYQPVKEAGDVCINDFECSNNACVDGECFSVRVELETQREILEEQTSILQEIRCWIRSLIGVQDYDECLNESLGG